MSLPTLKKHVYTSMAQGSPAVAKMEAMTNIMQATCTILQSSPILGEDTLCKGRNAFLGLLSYFVTDTVKVIIMNK